MSLYFSSLFLKFLRIQGALSINGGKTSLFEKNFKLVCCVFILAFLVGCQAKQEGLVVAKVGNRKLLLSELEARIPIHLIEKVGNREKLRLVESWVEGELFYREALDRGLDEDPLVSNRISDAIKHLLVAEYLEQEFERSIEILEGDILDYYQTHRSEFVREFPEIRARHILVPDREALSQVWERLRGGEIFQVVAREESIDSSAEDGGELGYFSKNSADASFWEACQKARKGKPIRISTQLGYHIIEVLDRREVGSVPDLIEVRGKIWQRLYAQRRHAKREKILEELRNRFSWSIFLEQIEDDITSPK